MSNGIPITSSQESAAASSKRWRESGPEKRAAGTAISVRTAIRLVAPFSIEQIYDQAAACPSLCSTGSTSKVLFPSLSLGYLVLPASLLEEFAALRTVLDDHDPLVDQVTLSDSALDIACLENIQTVAIQHASLPALRASEAAMPNNYIASLRLAQMEMALKHYDDTSPPAIADWPAPGANGRARLPQIEARAGGQIAEAHRALAQALQAAQNIPIKGSRDMNLPMIKNALQATARNRRYGGVSSDCMEFLCPELSLEVRGSQKHGRDGQI
jgi:hypothetical protein